MIVPSQVGASVLEDFLTGALFCVQKHKPTSTTDFGDALTIDTGSIFLNFRSAIDSSGEMIW